MSLTSEFQNVCSIKSITMKHSTSKLSKLSILLLFLLIADSIEVAPHLSAQTTTSESHSLPTRVASQFLPNAIRVTASLYSGGLPEGDNAFAELQSLGVRTVISVDGAAPDIETARKHGLRYIHLPHGYDGVPEARGLELAKAINEIEGPIYIHCHHGKHRSPAATAVACIVSGRISNIDGKALLELAGTNPNYRGLWSRSRAPKRCPCEASWIGY